MGHGFQCQRQQHPLHLTAGQVAHSLVDQCFCVYTGQALQNRITECLSYRQEGGPPGQGADEQIQYTDGIAMVKTGILRHIADAQLFCAAFSRGEYNVARILPLTQNGPNQGGLACAVGADQSDHLAAVHVYHIFSQYLQIS